MATSDELIELRRELADARERLERERRFGPAHGSTASTLGRGKTARSRRSNSRS